MSYIEESLSAGEKVEGLFRLRRFSWMPVKRQIESISHPAP